MTLPPPVLHPGATIMMPDVGRRKRLPDLKPSLLFWGILNPLDMGQHILFGTGSLDALGWG